MTCVRLTAIALLMTGCHTTYRRALGELDTVNAQAFTTSAPTVNLGSLYEDDLVAMTVNTYQGVQENRAERRIREALRPEGVTTALVSSFGDALGSGPPLQYTTSPTSDATIQLEVTHYGMEVPFLGAQGTFDYRIRVRGYREDGRPFYRTRVNCSNAAGAPRDVSVAFGTVNNVRQLEQMSDAQIQSAFEKVAEWCAWEVVRKMRKHAG